MYCIDNTSSKGMRVRSEPSDFGYLIYGPWYEALPYHILKVKNCVSKLLMHAAMNNNISSDWWNTYRYHKHSGSLGSAASKSFIFTSSSFVLELCWTYFLWCQCVPLFLPWPLLPLPPRLKPRATPVPNDKLHGTFGDFFTVSFLIFITVASLVSELHCKGLSSFLSETSHSIEDSSVERFLAFLLFVFPSFLQDGSNRKLDGNLCNSMQWIFLSLEFLNFSGQVSRRHWYWIKKH